MKRVISTMLLVLVISSMDAADWSTYFKECNLDLSKMSACGIENKKMLDLHNNSDSRPMNSNSKSKHDSGCVVLGMSESSVLDNSEVQIYVEREPHGEEDIKRAKGKIDVYQARGNFIVVKNKTNKPIYIDLSKCYRIEDYRGKDVDSPVFDLVSDIEKPKAQYGQLMGYCFGENAVRVEPYGERHLPLREGHYELFHFRHLKKKLNIKISEAEPVSFRVDTTPARIDYIVTYSKDKEVSDYTVMTFSLYVKEMYGGHMEDKITYKVIPANLNTIIGSWW